ncbi:MAG: EscU/YscU/HrcU family type III secretion system export apparatus switch protein, partial [Kofleriaceae bacterium]
MSDKPFPPSARRAALARQAGLHAASPIVVAGAAAAAIALAVSAVRFALGDAIVAACRSAAWHGATAGDPSTLGVDAVAGTVLAIAAPLLVAAALAAVLAHLAQTRRLWNPRRQIDRAPALEGGPAVRARGAAFDLLMVAVVGAVGLGWVWLIAPRLATLVELEPRAMLGAAGALGAGFV